VTADLAGHCSVCGLTVPATVPAHPYEQMARLVEHQHRNPRFDRCIGSRMLTPRLQGDVQIHLFGETGAAA